ncbi:MAG: TetR/AcrR family transcriptional regulator [Ruminococcus sp.]|nr:TetR/AcrR family transcriptional regulator [Ruminococcus sp.]
MAMSPERRAKVSAEKHEMIQNAALQLFDRKGYKATTISDIAECAGISKGLVYKYFKSKKDILLSFQTAIDECGAVIEAQETPKESLRISAQRVLLSYEKTKYHAPMRVLIACYAQGDISSEEISTAYSFEDYGRIQYGPIFRKGQELGEFRTGDPEEMGDIFWHIIIGYAVQMIHMHNKKCTEKTIEEILDLFC